MDFAGSLRNDVLEKLMAFCAYQDRCKQDVVKKLNKLEVPTQHQQGYIAQLVEEKFIDESRFTRAFIKGKLNQNKWGKRKIKYALQQKKIPDYLIVEGFEQIEEDSYFLLAVKVAKKKQRSLKETDTWKRKQKIQAYLAQKGFEFDVIKRAVSEVESND